MNASRLSAVLLGLVLLAACTTARDEAAEPDPEPVDVTAAASAACEGEPVTPTAEPERVDLTSGGEQRWYLRSVPPAAADGVPVPVVVDFHGYSSPAEVQIQMSSLDELGAQAGFVTIFPHGDGGGRVVPGWEVGLGSADLDFFGDLLDDVEATLCVDTNRIYVTGLSNGAFMASAIACEFADRVAAIAPVAGIRSIDGCDPARPVPVVSFHGTDDDFVTFGGGLGGAVADLPTPDGSGTLGEAGVDAPSPEESPGPTIPDIVAEWAVLGGCGAEPAETRIADDVVHVTFECPSGVAVELYVVEGGGHAWPGSEFSAAIESVVGHTTFSISASDVMWAFFEAHPLRTTEDGE